jgi:hypothetical protein
MKTKITLLVVLLSLLTFFPGDWVSGQSTTDRPVVIISSYTPFSTPSRGQNFSMAVYFHNSGMRAASNLIIDFVPGELIPRNNGGTQTIYQLISDETKSITQEFTVSPDLWGAYVGAVTVNVEYSDYEGNVYNDSFSIAVDLSVPAYAPAAATPTPTAAPIFQPQLVIESYASDVEILQPGTTFELTLGINNLGNAEAKAISMVMGGGSLEVNPEGTPQPGISGGEGEFTNFAPLDSSNVKFIGDLKPGETLEASQKIVVNVSTSPGAYSLKYSFVYTNESGEKVVENQVITLLVYRMPSIEVGFYQDTGPIYANQPNFLPLQIVNLGKQSAVLGNMTVSAEDSYLENSSALVGLVDAGFYFTLDTMITPEKPGPLEIQISVNYTDDFNQPRTYTTVIPLEVLEAPIMDNLSPDGEGMQDGIPTVSQFPDVVPDSLNGVETFSQGGVETFWQKIGRFFKGLFGLDSGSNDLHIDPQFPNGG